MVPFYIVQAIRVKVQNDMV